MAVTTRNRQLASLLRTFPKQNGLNLTEFQLNVGLSNMIALDREIPDTRPRGCSDIVYSLEDLPTVSVIIPFYNEAWSMLLRCLHSIIDRSPPHLIKEVILVDDNSDYHYLKDTLVEYTSVLSAKIRIIRNKEREGLIRARVLAARQAVGDVIVFLDAHVECNQGWLPPLLQVIKNNKQTIAVPHIDNIMPNTIKYSKWRGYGYGGFQWNMDYVWKMVPTSVLKKRLPSDNYITPTTIGCAMVIDRDYFFRLGGFDDDMYIWGGENLEISFRTWMCGGSMVIVPCSRVGHVFRRWLPYSFPSKYGGRYVKFKNYQRVADVWMGEYSLYYYAAIQGEVYYEDKDISSLKKRKEIIGNLQCKSFKWYLDNIVQDMTVPSIHALFYGQFKVLGGNACLSGYLQNHGRVLPVTYCGMQSSDQIFMYMQDFTIVHQDRCLTATSQNDVTLVPCATRRSDQKWLREPYDSKDLIYVVHPEAKEAFHRYSIMIGELKYCLTHMNIQNQEVLGILSCSNVLENSVFQFWSFTLKLDFTFARNVLDKRKKPF
jgi:polypeptide N-acetylgalactosaminyltransferase